MKEKKRPESGDGLSFRPVVRYIIWFYVIVLVAELLVGGGSALRAMEREGEFVVASTKSQVDYRISNTLKLLTSLADSEMIRDPSIPYPTKAAELTRYSNTFGYMMICIVDKAVNVWDEEGSNANLGGRDYMQRLFTTGEPQVTDSFPAGVDGVTLNYTVAVPILKDGEVDGALFAAIYFDEIVRRVQGNSFDSYQQLALIGSENQVMIGARAEDYGRSYLDLVQDKILLGNTAKQVEEDLFDMGSGSYWSVGGGNLNYVAYAPISDTHWTLMCKLDFWGTLAQFFPQLLGMMFISTLACGGLVVLTKRFVQSQRGTVDMLVASVQELEKKIYQNEKPDNVDFQEIISLTSKGLTDGLTGAITRTVFLNQVPNKIRAMEPGTLCAVCFVDMDNLKTINDGYGHDMGDMALKSVGYTLREYEKKYDGLVGRYGGDEFVVLLMGFPDRQALDELLEEMTARLHAQISTGKVMIPTQCSIGVAVCRSGDTDAEQLIKEADDMLYRVKQSGKGRYQIAE